MFAIGFFLEHEGWLVGLSPIRYCDNHLLTVSFIR